MIETLILRKLLSHAAATYLYYQSGADVDVLPSFNPMYCPASRLGTRYY
jgi:hypothetical protein